MKKDNRGFFLAETIIVLTLVTTVMAFVYPNVAKLYENYKLQVKYYDQPEDIYALKAIYEANKSSIDDNTKAAGKLGCRVFGQNEIQGILSLNNLPSTINLVDPDRNTTLYLTGYMTNISDANFNFNRYLKRMKKTTNEPSAYRLIGVFKNGTDTRYASIKIDNPNLDGACN